MSDPEQRAFTWVAEMPVPSTNLLIHFESYVLEQWLRRIALAALMARGGARWVDSIPGEVLPEARKQVNLLKRRTFLDPENSDNLIWALTLESLRQVLTADDLVAFVFELTGLARRDLARELEKFRDIRNIVAHHRATNDVAFDNFERVAKRLHAAIQHFKLRLLYQDQLTVIHSGGSEPQSEVAEVFESSGLAADRWFLLMDRGRFYEFGVVWGDPVLVGGFVDVGNLLDLFHGVRREVLCVQLPQARSEGYEGELSVLWPKDVSHSELEAIRDACLGIRRDSNVPYEQQDAKHICDPMIWFEQGRQGAAAAGSAIAQEQLDWFEKNRDVPPDDDIPF